MFNAWFDLCARNDVKVSDGFVLIFPAISNGKDGDQVVIAVVVIETVVGATVLCNKMFYENGSRQGGKSLCPQVLTKMPKIKMPHRLT